MRQHATPAVLDVPAGARQRIGLLGGSFNPAHRGHLLISQVAVKLLKLDRVVWLVTPRNPLKAPESLNAYAQRVCSARSVAGRDRRITVSEIEARAGLNYTIDTVRLLARLRPATRFVFLMGADNLTSLPRWRNWTGLLAAIPIAVFARPGIDLAACGTKVAQRYGRLRLPLAQAARLASGRPPIWLYVPFTHEASSATAIRAAGVWPPKR